MDMAADYLRAIALTLAGVILDAEALVAHKWLNVCSAKPFFRRLYRSFDSLVTLLEPAQLPVRPAIIFVSIFVHGHESCDKDDIQIHCLALIAAVRYRLTQLAHGIAAVCWADETLIVDRCRHGTWQVSGCLKSRSGSMAWVGLLC